MTQGSWCIMANSQGAPAKWQQASNSQGKMNQGVIRRIGEECDVATAHNTEPALVVLLPHFLLASTWALPYHFERFFMAPAKSAVFISEDSQCWLRPVKSHDILGRWR